MARFFLCSAAACCCCVGVAMLLLLLPVQGRLGTGLVVGGSGGGGYRLQEPQLHVAERRGMQLGEEGGEQRGGVRRAEARSSPSWSSAAAAGRARARAELRSVPGGPDPLHHHGSSPRRPELERAAP